MSKEKLNFAQRVSVKITPRDVSNSGANQARIELFNAINKHKVEINKAEFVKTESEKHQLKVAKHLWKQRVA
jgi:hypothetical protein